MAYIHLTSVIPPKPTCATGNPAGEPAPAVSLPQLHALDIDEWRARFPLIAMAQSSSQCGNQQPRSMLAATEELEREASYRSERSDDESEQASAMLLRRGADAGRVDERGESALTLAVKTDSVLALHLLRPYLAKLEPARRRELFTTALELAIAREAEAMIEVLGYVGAELHAFDGAQ